MPAKGNKQVVLDGRGPLTLRDGDYITTGGEGSIYRANSTIIKLYTDPAKMVRDGMVDKVKTLSTLKHDSIVAPQGLVLDGKGAPIGFYMPFVEGEPLARVFVNDFRTRTNFGTPETLTLVDRMRDTVAHAHSQKAVMVDANELNWIVNHPHASGPVPYVIDVDSWAVGKWPATVIMPSIRDWNAKAFDAMTDWFAWGILTFMVFTGIHPYKGKLDGYKPGELERRMKDNASVFMTGVRLPHVVRDFGDIPGPLLDWYRATFTDGERTVPPSPRDTRQPAKAARVMRTVLTGTAGKLVYTKLFGRAGNPVLRTWPCGAAWLASGDVVDMSTNLRIGRVISPDAEVLKTAGGWLLADWVQGRPVLTFSSNQQETVVDISFACSRFFRSGNRLFAVMEQEMAELGVRTMGKTMVTISQRWPIRTRATQWFENMAIVDMLGATFLYLPLADGGMAQVRVKELEGLTVVTAKAGNRFATVIAVDRAGDYRKLELTFGKDMTTYTLWQGGADSADLNAALLPGGVVATIVDDGELTIFVPANGQMKKVQDRDITTAMQLATWDDRVIYLKNGDVWQVKTA